MGNFILILLHILALAVIFSKIKPDKDFLKGSILSVHTFTLYLLFFLREIWFIYERFFL